MLANDALQVEHRDLSLSEYGLQLLVSVKHTLVILVLQTILLDVIPYLLNNNCTGYRFIADYSRKRCALELQEP